MMSDEVRKLRANIALVRMHINQTRYSMQWGWWTEAWNYYKKAQSAMQRCEAMAIDVTIGDR